jgi:hypothetical protein
MDATLAASIAELVKMGLAGIVIIGLCITVYTLWKTNLALTNQIAKLQEDRIADVRLCTSALVNAAGSMTASADATKAVQAAITNLVNELQLRRGNR